ncbi:MAG: hypothetical protein WBC96_08540 [Thermodesulfobacteriota bacterium]
MKLRLSILISAFLIVGLSFLAAPESALSQENVSLGCCKTVVGTPACEGCGEGGLKCAIDGQLCPETSNFSLGEVCAESSIAGEAECYAPEIPTGCCVDSANKCSDDTNFDSCTGQHWFEGAACSVVPACSIASSPSRLIDWVILGAAFAVVVLLLMKFRRKRHGR